MMAGFGGGGGGAAAGKKKGKKAGAAAASKPAVASLSPKKQWDRFKDHRKAGVDPVVVYARVKGTDAWLEVGDVTASDGATSGGSVQTQKRLILEHAVRVHPVLLPKARELECGLDAGGSTVVHEKTQAAEAASSGFVGRADASGRYGKTDNEINELAPTSLRAATKTVGGGQAADSKGVLS